MKYSELHRKIRKNKKWQYLEAQGSHYIYENGKRFPYHGAKEIPEGLRKKIEKEMRYENNYSNIRERKRWLWGII